MPQHGPPGDPHGKRGKRGRREVVRPEEETRGYRRRRAEHEEIEEAGGSLNVQTAKEVQRRRLALERQEHIIRLRRKRRPTP